MPAGPADRHRSPPAAGRSVRPRRRGQAGRTGLSRTASTIDGWRTGALGPLGIGGHHDHPDEPAGGRAVAPPARRRSSPASRCRSRGRRPDAALGDRRRALRPSAAAVDVERAPVQGRPRSWIARARPSTTRRTTGSGVRARPSSRSTRAPARRRASDPRRRPRSSVVIGVARRPAHRRSRVLRAREESAARPTSAGGASSHRTGPSPMGRMPYRTEGPGSRSPEMSPCDAPRSGSVDARGHCRGAANRPAGWRSQAVRQPARRRPDDIRRPVVADVEDRRARPARPAPSRAAAKIAGCGLIVPDPLADDHRREVRQPARGLGVPIDGRRERPVAQDRRGALGRASRAEHRADARDRRQPPDEGPAVGVDGPVDLRGLEWRRRCSWSQRSSGGGAAIPRSRANTRTSRSARSTSRNCGTSSRNWRSRSSAQTRRKDARSIAGDRGRRPRPR